MDYFPEREQNFSASFYKLPLKQPYCICTDRDWRRTSFKLRVAKQRWRLRPKTETRFRHGAKKLSTGTSSAEGDSNCGADPDSQTLASTISYKPFRHPSSNFWSPSLIYQVTLSPAQVNESATGDLRAASSASTYYAELLTSEKSP